MYGDTHISKLQQKVNFSREKYKHKINWFFQAAVKKLVEDICESGTELNAEIDTLVDKLTEMQGQAD